MLFLKCAKLIRVLFKMCANIAQCHARSALMLLDSGAKLRYSTHILILLIPKSNNKNSKIDKRCLKPQTLQYVI